MSTAHTATPLVDALAAKWGNAAANREPAYIQMRDLAQVLECSKDRLVADVAWLKEHGKKIVASEMERTAEVIRLRDVNADFGKALMEIAKNDPFNQSSAGIIARAALSKTGA